MFIWREVQTRAGYSDEMIRYRNALVREINFVFSPRFNKIHEDERIAQEYDSLKKNHERLNEGIFDPITKAKVEHGMVLEAIAPVMDFKTAELFMRYFGITVEDVGKDIHYEMRQPDSIYQRLLNEKRWLEVSQFIKFFPAVDAADEFESMFKKISEEKNTDIFMVVIKELEQPPFDRLKRDEGIRKILEKECDRAINEMRLDQALEIVTILDDRERENLIKAAESLMKRQFEEGFKFLNKTVLKDRLQKLIVELHEEEMKRGEKDNEGFRNAFFLALHGNLVTDDLRRYIEQPANKMIEHLIGNPAASDQDYKEAAKYAAYANPRTITNIIAKRCLDLITQNDTKEAEQLKTIFNPNFVSGMYDEEKNIKAKFAQLTETKGIHDIPKGEENLKMAYDIAVIFNFPKNELQQINELLCKFYIANKKFEKAAASFDQDNEAIMELIESEIEKRIQVGDYVNPYKMVYILKIKFSRKNRNRQEKTLRELLAKYGTDIDQNTMAKLIVRDDIYDLNIIPFSYYRELFSFGLGGGRGGADLLVELKDVMIRHMDTVMRIELQKMVSFYQQNNDPVGAKLLSAYNQILPPSILDYLFYFILKIFGLT